VLIQDEETVLIDTGAGIELLKQLKNAFDIDYVINSHSHIDHCAGNWVFHDKPIYVPHEAYTTGGNLVALSERFVNDKLAPTWRQFAQDATGFRDCKPTQAFTERDSFEIGSIELRPIHTPGHTQDHYCFFFERKGILFSFDYDLTSFPWYGHEESNIPEFRESITKLQALSPKVVVSSHRDIITEKIDKEFQKYSIRIDERTRRIFSLLQKVQTVDELVNLAPIYGKFPYAAPLLRYWEKQMILKHLVELVKVGKVIQRGQAYFQT
jgi:glyoxylase-like metal-dependent hydrolase (beta-lactamase superfamily II)